MTSSFQPQARPVDTFVRQSRVAAVNTQDAFGQLASALSIINPSLRKLMESEIDKQRSIVGAEAEQAAKEIYDPTSPSYVNLYNDAVDQQFPENAELENTEEEWGNTLQNVEKTRGSTEAQILAGRSPWFKHNFNKRKATLLGQTFADNLQNRFYTDTALDDKGIERPISSFPTNSTQFQNWQATNRSPYIEKLDVEPYYFNKFFVPELDKGHDKVQELSRTTYPQQAFESYKQVSVNKINTAINKYKKLQGLQGEALANAEKDLRDDLANDNKEIRRLFKGKNFNSLLKIQINTIKENALEIAFSGQEGAVDKARTLLNDFAKYFPTNDSGTSVLKNHPEFLKIKNQFEKDMLELEDDILDNTEKLNKEQLQNTAYNLLSNPDTTAQDVQNFLQQNPSSDIADYMNETVVLARPETFNRLDQLEINALTEGFYPNKLTAMQELRSWYNSTLKLPSQREAFIRVKQSIDENFSGELSSLTKNKNYINGEIAAEFKTNDGLDFQKARDGINMRDIQRETTKKLDAFYKREAGKGTPPSEAEIRNEAERLAELAVEEARAYIYAQGSTTQEDVIFERNRGKLNLIKQIFERTRDQETGERPTVETVTEQYKEYEPDITPEELIKIIESQNIDASSFLRNVEKYVKVEETSKQEFSDLRGGDSQVDGFGNLKEKSTGETNTSTNKETPARPDVIPNPLNLSQKESETFLSNLRRLIEQPVAAGTLEGKPVAEETKQTAESLGIVGREQTNGVKRFETNFPIFYKLAKEAGHKFPELTAAQAMQETGNGESPSGRNNYLGLQASQRQIQRGQSSNLETQEDLGRGLENTRKDFVDFDDIRDQMKQYKQEWNDPFSDRKGIVSVDTVEEALDLILSKPDDLYATDKDYKAKVLQLIKDAKRNPPLF